MKVTVTFGDTAVVVPCKAGWTVRDLLDQATRRYRKVVEQRGEWSVRTHHVEYCDGGILDMDDLLADLVDDRDKLVASFEEVHRGAAESPGSGASNGHSSPAPSPEPIQYHPHLAPQPIRGEIEVNEAVLRANNTLLVRSSSDSALAPPLEIRTTPPLDNHYNSKSAGPDTDHVLKGASDRLRPDPHTAKMKQVLFSSLTKTVELSGDKGPLGIHVVPFCSSLSGRMLGLHIKGVEENSRSRRENIFREDESIVQINDTPLIDKTFAQSQEVFRQALGSPLLRLEVLPVYNKPRYEKSLIGQLFHTEGHNPSPSTHSPLVARARTTDPKDAALEARPPDVRAAKTAAELQPGHGAAAAERAPSAVPSPPAASPSPPAVAPRPPLPAAAPQTRSQSPPPARKSPEAALPPGLVPLATKKAGKKMKIDLKKGTEGLGFTVVTRDSTVHGPGPILVKNILPRGAAIKDGRLLPGDRILEVNGVDMTGRSQEELVAMLRSTKQGESVSVVVSRQDDIFLPRELKEEDGLNLVLEDGREQIMYEIPLNDTGSAGLGLSLKGNKHRETGEDLGIFIKSIIHGGAAHKDGRLRVNDQLTGVNGEALLGRSNHAAMETLRRSMSSEGTARGTIQLLLLRSGTQTGSGSSAPEPSESSSSYQPSLQPSPTSDPQELQERLVAPPTPPSPDYVYQGPDHASGPPFHPTDYQASGPPHPTYHHAASGSPTHHPTDLELNLNAPPQSAAMNNGHGYHHGFESAAAPYASASTEGSRYGGDEEEEEEEEEEDFPPPPSPGAVAEMNREVAFPPPPHHREFDVASYTSEEGLADTHVTRLVVKDNTPRNRASKSMDLVADESNMRSLAGHGAEPPAAGVGALGPTLGLWKSSSLESLQTAVQEARQRSDAAAGGGHAAVPFHRPSPHIMVRGRGCNQSFRAAIDRSYEGAASEPDDDEDLSEQSSGRDTPASGSSRQELDTDDGKSKKNRKKKAKAKKEKKTKGKDTDPEKKKRKGFGLLRFGKKKEDKGKEATKTAKNKLEALNEEEQDKNLDEMVRSEPRYAEVRPATEATAASSLPDMDDDDMDPNYARIEAFRQQPPSPSRSAQDSRTPSPRGSHSRQPSQEDLEGLYAKVNKPRAPQTTTAAAAQSHNPAPSDSERVQAWRREFHQSRAAPSYDELETARRKVLDHDPHRMVPRGADARPAPRYEDVERQYATHPRRADPHEPASSRSRPEHRREPAPYPGKPPVRVPAVLAPSSPQPAPHLYPASPRVGQQQQRDRAALRQDVPPSPSAHRVAAAPPGYRHASPGRYISPERYQPGGREGRYASPGRYISPERQHPHHPHPGGRERYASPGRYISPERQPGGGARYASPARYISPERQQQPGGGARAQHQHHHHHASPERYGYRDRRQPDPRHKNPMMGVV